MKAGIVAKVSLTILHIVVLVFLGALILFPQNVSARSYPNCKEGVHMISASEDDYIEAAGLLNSNGGDYCWVVVVLREDEMTYEHVQPIENIARKNHLNVVYRLEKGFDENGNWYMPDVQTIQKFIDVYKDPRMIPSSEDIAVVPGNEPTHKIMCGNCTPETFARWTLQAIRMLHDAEEETGVTFHVGMAGQDLASPQDPSNGYYDAGYFMDEMFKTEPDLLCEVDMWVSHSYPRSFVGSSLAIGRLSVRGYQWELAFAEQRAKPECKDHVRNLPVYITETGYRVGTSGIDDAQARTHAANMISIYQNDPRVYMYAFFAYRFCGEPFEQFAIIGCDASSMNGVGQALLDAPKTRGDVNHIRRARTRIECPQELVENTEATCTITAKNLGTDIWKDIGGDYGLTLLGVGSLEGIDEDDTRNPHYSFSRFREVEPTHDLNATLTYNPGELLGEHNITIGLSRQGKLVLGLANIHVVSFQTPTLDLRVKGFFGKDVSQENINVQVFDKTEKIVFRTETDIVNGVADVGEVPGVLFGTCYRVVLLVDGSLPVQDACVQFNKGHNSVEMPRLLAVDRNNDGALTFDDIRP